MRQNLIRMHNIENQNEQSWVKFYMTLHKTYLGHALPTNTNKHLQKLCIKLLNKGKHYKIINMTKAMFCP